MSKPAKKMNLATALVRTGPSPAMQALFASAPAMSEKLSKLERRNLPLLIKPGDVPEGGLVSGEIVKIVPSPVSTVKGKLLWLKHESGQEYLFPCTGVIRSALAPGIEGDEALMTALEKEVGKLFFAKRLPDKMNQKFKKNMFMFDVYTSSK